MSISVCMCVQSNQSLSIAALEFKTNFVIFREESIRSRVNTLSLISQQLTSSNNATQQPNIAMSMSGICHVSIELIQLLYIHNDSQIQPWRKKQKKCMKHSKIGLISPWMRSFLFNTCQYNKHSWCCCCSSKGYVIKRCLFLNLKVHKKRPD